MSNKSRSRVTLRMKITLSTAIALTVIAVSITGLSIYNARQITFIPQGESTSWNDINRTPIITNPDVFFELGEHGVIGIDELFELIAANNTAGNIDSIPRLPIDEVRSHLSGHDALVELERSQQIFQIHSIIIAAAAVLFGTLAAYFISEKALKPIKILAEKVEGIDAKNLSQPIDPPSNNDEVSRLTHSFNCMLRKLKRSFESQKLFAQNASHELKTPLAAIRANIEVLQMAADPSVDDYKEVINIVKDSNERLIELSERLLSLNDIEGEIKWQSFRCKEVFNRILADLYMDIESKNLSVSIEGECHIMGDKPLLERAFSNLVHNAIRYNVDNGTVSIRLEESSIIIEDSGVGIPREHIQHIFEPFYCVDKSRSKALGGHGLGMAIAKNIFDKHEMEIFVFSEPGNGTKIFLSK